MQLEKQWTLCSVFGIPVRLNLSVVLLAVYVLYVVFDADAPLLSVLIGGYFAVVLLLSILLHELAHSVCAIAFGGRVRDITLQLLGGCAAIERMPPRPWQECLMAAAGPLCSIVLAVAGWGLSIQFGQTVRGWTQQGFYVQQFVPNLWFEVVAMLNAGLACFNLLPAFPMDGGRILRSGCQIFGKSKVAATEIAVTVGRAFAVVWIALAVFDFAFGIGISAPEGLPSCVAYLWNIVLDDGGIFRLLIAYMIWVSGKRELDYVRLEAEYNGGWR